MPPKRGKPKSEAPAAKEGAPSNKQARMDSSEGATFSSLPGMLTDPGWRDLLQPLFLAESWKRLTSQLDSRRAAGETIYPPISSVFRAFNMTPLSRVRVVILGQDPYHGPGQADGLAFSFSGGTGEALPPSLKNIFKELQADIDGFQIPKAGSLEKWARQGVLLLNTALTVAEHKAGSHTKLGWTEFTDGALSLLSRQAPNPLVFLLWGKPAQSKAKLLAGAQASGGPAGGHVILTAAHPSPLAGGAFAGCRHFSKANAAARPAGVSAIDWRLD